MVQLQINFCVCSLYTYIGYVSGSLLVRIRSWFIPYIGDVSEFHSDLKLLIEISPIGDVKEIYYVLCKRY